jgi:hypothetical protein
MGVGEILKAISAGVKTILKEIVPSAAGCGILKIKEGFHQEALIFER